MHILHLSPFYAPYVGGAQTYLQAISKRLVKDGHQVTVVTSDATSIASIWSPRLSRATPEQEVLDGVQVIRCPIAHRVGYPLLFHLTRRVMVVTASQLPSTWLRWLGQQVPGMPTLKCALAKLIQSKSAWDVVHGVNITVESPVLMAEQVAGQQGIPLISTPFVHVGPAQVMRSYVMPHQLNVLQNSAVIFVQTAREQDALVKRDVKTPMIQLGMGVDPIETSTASPFAFRERYALSQSEPIVLFMGTLSYDKGVVHAVQAMHLLWQQGISTKLVLAGDKPDGQLDKALARLSPVEQAQVIQVGVVSGMQKQELLAASTLLVLPSQVDSFGIVFLEAWLHSKPVIGADAGGIPDVIAHGQDGFVVPFGHVQALANQIQHLIEQPEFAQQLGKQGRQKVLQHFTWDQVYQRWLAGLSNTF